MRWSASAVLAAVALAHAPYVLWLVRAPELTMIGTSLAALGAAVALLRASARQASSAPQSPTAGALHSTLPAGTAAALYSASLSRTAVALYSASLCTALLGAVLTPLAWLVSAPLAAAAWLVQSAGPAALTRGAALIALCASAFPLARTEVGAALDLALQQTAATLAAPGIALTGLSVTRAGFEALPTLILERVQLRITDACAGTAGSLAQLSLALVVAEVLLRGRARLALALVAVTLDFWANVGRIVVEAHVASAWSEDPRLWPLAHDLVSVATALATWTVLLVLTWRLGRGRVQNLKQRSSVLAAGAAPMH